MQGDTGYTGRVRPRDDALDMTSGCDFISCCCGYRRASPVDRLTWCYLPQSTFISSILVSVLYSPAEVSTAPPPPPTTSWPDRQISRDADRRVAISQADSAFADHGARLRIIFTYLPTYLLTYPQWLPVKSKSRFRMVGR